VNVAAGANIAAARDNALASRRTRTQTATAVPHEPDSNTAGGHAIAAKARG